ncbi:MAG: FprA family A-type flavoprotein, partial [Clostridiales bacterium]|nr:FprA family A-type flavoprotein [Clostridiales bacterium]
APMVHWPEVMVTYEQHEKILFSADGFGKFGTLDTDEDWTDEARRYYINIVGKYGAQVQALLKKASALDIKMICPLHGPILKENLGFYLEKYNIWSSYTAEDEGVLVAYASIHGNTKNAAKLLVEKLKARGVQHIAVADLSRDDMAQAVSDAFRYSRMIVAASSYDAGVFPCMETFLRKLKAKAYQSRRVAIVENGSWAPTAAKCMRAILEEMKNIQICGQTVTIKSAVKPETLKAFDVMLDELLA